MFHNRRCMILGLAAVTLLAQPGCSPEDYRTSVPEAVGLSSQRLARIDELWNRYIDEGKIPGVVTVIARHGETVHFRTQGRMDIDDGRVMRPDAIFRIASMTKPITSVALMILYEEGRFQLEDPISLYVPEMSGVRVLPGQEAWSDSSSLIDAGREISVGDLLLHTAGLGPGSIHPQLDSLYRQLEESHDYTLEERVVRLAELPLLFQPGTQWNYSDAGTDVLGYMIENLSGITFEQFVRDRVLQPLGMIDTDFFVPEDKSDRLASLYRVSDIEGMERANASFLPANPHVPPTAPRAAAGLYSTASDYLRFAQMLLNGGELAGVRLLGRKTVELMTQDHLPIGVTLPDQFGWKYRLEGYGFGLGFRVRTDVAKSQLPGSVGEYGWAGGCETYFLVDPNEDLIALFMTQLMPSTYYPIRREFTTLVYQAIVN